MRTHRPCLLATALATSTALLLVAACQEDASTDCKGNDDCSSGEVCNLLTGQCIRDSAGVQELNFTGTFECPLSEHDELDLKGMSDVQGAVEGAAVRLSDPACALTADGKGLTVTLFGAARSSKAARERFLLVFETPIARSFDDTRLAVLSAFPGGPPRAGEVVVHLSSALEETVGGGIGDVLLRATGRSGELRLSGRSSPGSTLSGVIDVRLRKLAGDELGAGGAVGSACDAPEDCDINLGLGCFDTFGSICTASCADQAECDPFDATCTFFPGLEKGLCLLGCDADVDCSVEGFVCSHSAPDEGVCTPGFIGRADDDALGRACADADDCPTTGCLTNAEGAGMCTLACETSDDCWLYLDTDAICLPITGGKSVCFERCSDDRSCPDGLSCDERAGQKVCDLPETTSTPADAGMMMTTPADAGMTTPPEPEGLPPSTSLTSAIDRYARLMCGLETRCNALFLKVSAGSESYCVEQVSRSWKWASALPATGLTIESMDACAQTLSELTCDEYHAPSRGCSPLGSRQNGEACADNTQCASGWCQSLPFACGSCSDYPMVGSSCANSLECPSGTLCLEGECTARGLEGQACSDALPCHSVFLTCVAGVCRHNERRVGQSCGPGSGQPFCDQETASLACNASSVCQVATVANPGQACPSFGFCGARGSCVNNVCTAGPGPGDACSAQRPCRWPNACIDSKCVGIPAGDVCAQ